MKKISTYLIAILFCSLIAPLAIGDANNPEVLEFSEEITVEKEGSDSYSTSMIETNDLSILRLKNTEDSLGCWINEDGAYTWTVGGECEGVENYEQFEEVPPIVVAPCEEKNEDGTIEYSSELDCGTQVVVKLESETYDVSSGFIRGPGGGDVKDTGCWVVTHTRDYDAYPYPTVTTSEEWVDPCPVIIDDGQSTTAEEEGSDTQARSSTGDDETGCWVVVRDGNSGKYGQKVWHDPCPYSSTAKATEHVFEMDYPGEPTTPDSNKPEGCMVVTHSNSSNNAAVVSTLQYVDRCPVIDGIDNSSSDSSEAEARSDDEGCWVVVRDGNSGKYGEKKWEDPCPYKQENRNSFTITLGILPLGDSSTENNRGPGGGDVKDTGCWVETYTHDYDVWTVTITVKWVDPCPVIIDDGQSTTAEEEGSDTQARSSIGEGEIECYVVFRNGNTGEYGDEEWYNSCPHSSNVVQSMSASSQPITLPDGNVLILNFVGIDSTSLPCHLDYIECTSYSGNFEKMSVEGGVGCWEDRVWTAQCKHGMPEPEPEPRRIPGFTVTLSFMSILIASLVISRRDSALE